MALSLRPRRPLHQDLQCLTHQLRLFSVSSRQNGHNQALANSHSKLPEYPYGPSRWYKQSNFGLYGGLKISSGNNVSAKTETKTRRKWRPNVQMKRLYSHALQRYVRVKVATRVLRTIDKCGGLDEYVVGEKPARIKELGMKGWALRCKVMDTAWWKARVVEGRDQLGLSPIRRYVPAERDDEEGNEFLIGLYGEKVQDAAAAKEQALDVLEEAEPEYDGDGNVAGRPDLIAYDDAEVDASESTEGVFAEVGRIQAEPEPQYLSGKHKRRAIVKERKAQSAEARAAYKARRVAEGLAAPPEALRANDLKQQIAYQKRKDLEAAQSLLNTAEAAAPVARPTL